MHSEGGWTSRTPSSGHTMSLKVLSLIQDMLEFYPCSCHKSIRSLENPLPDAHKHPPSHSNQPPHLPVVGGVEAGDGRHVGLKLRPSVAWRHEKTLAVGALRKLPGQGVLPAPRAQQQHVLPSLRCHMAPGGRARPCSAVQRLAARAAEGGATGRHAGGGGRSTRPARHHAAEWSRCRRQARPDGLRWQKSFDPKLLLV